MNLAQYIMITSINGNIGDKTSSWYDDRQEITKCDCQRRAKVETSTGQETGHNQISC